MEVIRSKNPAEEAGKALQQLLIKYKDQSVLLMLSGGSALTLLDQIAAESLSENLTLTVLDERCSSDENINNFAQIEKTEFYKRASGKKVKTISTKVYDNNGCQEVAEKWETELREWRQENPSGIIIATVGIGLDGHTAGIMPGDYANSFALGKWAVSYEVPKEVNEYTKRITVTPTFMIEQIDFAIVYAAGKEKQVIVKRLENDTDCNQGLTPVCILRKMKSTWLFTDIDTD
ncbi:MAG: 6-phosphogluconolactonase [Candidatus Nomurabacteria bacterium]|nr:6-phosphogluconolactonase [Candidatus Nomurabacteria bacterium]USN87289.1 MAG: 6-phosphogluconolactonase [Candidatus Nomurabacteria bacterium]